MKKQEDCYNSSLHCISSIDQALTDPKQKSLDINSNTEKGTKLSSHSQSLRNHPLILEYASINDDLYKLIKVTNPTLRMFVDVAKAIVAGGEEE